MKTDKAVYYPESVMDFRIAILSAWVSGKNPLYETFFKGKKVLDIACGEGALVRKDPEHFSGIDINHSLVAKLQAEGLAVKEGSVTALPYADKEFDAIQSSNIIEHLTPGDAYQMLSEAVRVLRPGGVIVLTTPMPRTIWNTFGHTKPYPPSAIKKVLRPVSLESFDSISGLHIEHILYYGIWGSSKFAFLLSSLLALAFDSFRGSYTMILRKE